MQFPVEWYVHIVPGLVLLASIVIVLPEEWRKQLIKSIENQVIGSAIVLIVCAYILGLAENAIILSLLQPIANCFGFLQPSGTPSPSEWVTFHQYAQTSIIQTVNYGYQNMVLHRSLVLAITILLVLIINRLRRPRHRIAKLVAIVLLLLAGVSLFLEWREVRKTHLQYLNDTVQEAKTRKERENTVAG